MTVRKSRSRKFTDPQESVVSRVLEVLESGQRTYRYTDPIVHDDGRRIETRVKPLLWPLMLATPMEIEVEPQQEGGCTVTVWIRSQWFIYADIFGFYDRYIEDLFWSLR
jgi:hypothetical protein